jgi:autotransporter-associated beta strand protein
VVAFFAGLRVEAQTTGTWAASGSDTNWSSKSNWSGDVPLNAYYLIFGTGRQLTSNVDTAADVNFFNGITFSGTNGYTLKGNELGLVDAYGPGLITNNSTAAQTINTPINLNGVTPLIDTASGSLNLGGVIRGAAGVTKTGKFTLTLSGASTYTGATTVSAGTLEIAGGTAKKPTLGGTSNLAIESGGTLLFSGKGGTNNKVAAGTAVTMGSGKGGGVATLNTGGLKGLDQAFGVLTLTANSVIDFGALASGSQTLRFAASNAKWTGLTLSIWNWTAGVDHLYFGTSASGLDAGQLSQVVFYGGSGTGFLGMAGVVANGELSPIPEPSTVFALVGLCGVIGWRERKRLRRVLRR